jgi:hypothetical protein
MSFTYIDDIEWIGKLPRVLAVAAGLRILAPRPDRIPFQSVAVEPIDTGGAFRPDWRMQDPSKDPKEPYGGESSGTGNDHGWSNCTMVSAALTFAYQVQDKSGPQGGDMRHNQDDLSGGTDLYDARTAWDRYGNQSLTIKTGAGWGEVKKAHADGRAILIQGTGNVPGSESFDGSHACIIGPETNSDGHWLWGDPLASGWQWVAPSKIESWAKALHSSIMFAVSRIPASEPVAPEEPPAVPVGPDWSVVDFDEIRASAVAAYQSELLRDTYYWVLHPEGAPPFPIADTIAAVGHLNEGWGIGKWNQTTWYLSPTSGRWGQSVWAGTGSIPGGVWA